MGAVTGRSVLRPPDASSSTSRVSLYRPRLRVLGPLPDASDDSAS